MKRSRLLNLVMSGVLGAMAAIPPTTTLADDTEIYLGASANADGVRPNVLFVLDTSGSMSANIDDNGDRLDHMKDAFMEIMDTVNNINVGLMRFTDPGGPVLWPVSFIDEDVTVVEGVTPVAGFPINVRVGDSNDDASELVSTGTVDLVDTELNFVNSDAGAGTVSVSQVDNIGMRVLAQTDNAEEDSDDDIITQNRIDMNSDQTNGVRFSSVPVPPGATVTDARIIFTARDNHSSSPTFVIRGESNINPASFPTSCTDCADVTGRTTTSTFVTWTPGNWNHNDKDADTTTPNLSAVVQSLINLPGWVSGNPMAFIIEPSTTGGGRGAYTFQGAGGDVDDVAELVVSYSVAAALPEKEIAGMRFTNVAVPKGATITEAVLEFHPSALLTTDIDVDITGQLIGDAPAFTSAAGDLTGRTKTAPVNWQETDDWDEDTSVPPDGIGDIAQQSVDISSVVQSIVNHADWCGNNAMALFVQESMAAVNGPLKGLSFDGDQSRAPVLRINFDQANVPANACVNTVVTNQLFSSADDAEETISTGGVSLTGNVLNMDSDQVNALRFPDINITQGSTVIEASIVFAAADVDVGAATLRFHAEDEDDSDPLSSTSSDISDRSETSASADWAAPAFDTVDQSYQTVDISSLIQEVLGRAGWEAGNALTILQSHVAGAQRRARTFNSNAVLAPMLVIKVQGADATPAITVRSRLKELVDNLDHAGFTPIIDTLYEAALYYRGDPVEWGLQRGFDNASGDASCDSPPHRCNGTGSNPTVRQNTRVSHPASWTGGTVVRPANCTDANLNSPDCQEEAVTGDPDYETPITEACQANYIVLLTDGQANHNDSVPRITSEFGITCTGGTTDNETCGVELADFLANNDQTTDFSGDQTVSTYTIGFNFSSDFLADVAEAGNGDFFTADTGAELAAVFQTIITDILNRSTSFATPSLSVNAFNKLFDLNDVYFSLFIPDTRVAWRGNVKKYQICDDSAACELGSILDANDEEAINDADQRIKDTALSFWSSQVDGAEIEVGGAAENTPTNVSRNVYTFADLTTPIVNPLAEDLSLDVNEVIDTNDDGILDGLASSADHPDPEADTRFLLGDDAALLSAAERAELIDWIRGKDVDDEDEDGSTTDDRFTFSDPLHSSPIAITFGGTEVDPVIKLFVGTNDGGLQMLNAETGIEEWIFYPQSMLRQQADLRTNNNGDHIYGLDTVPATWIQDVNQDGIIDDDEGDFVRLIIGQRRGGLNYYAVDVTPGTVLTNPSATGGIDPVFLWRIDGGSADYPNLGQTWSRPVVSTVRVGTDTANETELQTVIAFTGGYEPGQDGGFFGESSPGNAIYFADAATGDILFTISADDPGGSLENLVVPGMTCPIPSDLAFFDSDGDGAEDRIYVGDTCGQVWRVDLIPDLDASESGVEVVVGKFAELSELDPDPSFVADHRKIFYRPDIVQVLNDEFTTVSRYDLIVVVTGLRDNPLNLSVQDRAYALRDFHVAPLTDTDGDGLADFGTYTTIVGPTESETGTLFDATTVVEDPEGAALDDFQISDGWYIDMTETGEKSLAAPVILSGKLFFTTYLPEGVVDGSTCALAEGSGRLFGVDVLTGGVVFNYDDADGTETLTQSDKIFTLGAGIPSSAVPIFQEEGITLLIGGGGGATVVDPDIDLPRGRTYWYQQ